MKNTNRDDLKFDQSFKNIFDKYSKDYSNIMINYYHVSNETENVEKKITEKDFTIDQYNSLKNNFKYVDLFLGDLYIDLLNILSKDKNKKITIIDFYYNKNSNKLCCEYISYDFKISSYWGNRFNKTSIL